MYEANESPLADGDFTRVFADLLGSLPVGETVRPAESGRPGSLDPAQVLHWGRPPFQACLTQASRRLLLPGSGIEGVDQLQALADLARAGRACILCLNHQSNLDVPTLAALLEDAACPELFERIVWIAGRKLEEDAGLTSLLASGFNRVVVSPRSWLDAVHTDRELRTAYRLNLAAHRAIRGLRHSGRIFGLFPAATRRRTDDPATLQAIDETDSYLKHFDYLLFARIEGCTLPVTRDLDLTHEVPRLDRVRYAFGPVQETATWRAGALARFGTLGQRSATARAMTRDLTAAFALADRLDKGGGKLGMERA